MEEDISSPNEQEDVGTFFDNDDSYMDAGVPGETVRPLLPFIRPLCVCPHVHPVTPPPPPF
jgi:hypothetical protein